MFKHILIPTDGSPLADKAVDRGIHFAAEIHAQVTLITVTQPFHIASNWPLVGADEYAGYAEQHGREFLAPGIEIARTFGVPCEAIAIEHEQPYAAIIDVATSQDCDLVAMASHGRRGFSAVVLGSETQKVLTHSRIPVLVLR